MAGVLCAYMLQQAGIPYVLAEAQSICSGITKNTTAKITVQHSLIYDKLIRKFGVEKARQYLEANESALANIVSCAEILIAIMKKNLLMFILLTTV